MSLRIRAVRLRARTEHAAVGSTIQFADGLNVVRAGNSSGKSQILQAIAFSLGVEGMFGPGRQVPLGSAMTDEVTTVEGGRARSAAVLASWCAVEIENARGDKVVAQRFAKHDRVLPNLVRVWHSPVLSAPPSRLPEPDAMFVREPGAAQNDRGFHRFLESFIGWELPRIPRYAGGDAPLYLEVLFPYLYVDQRAWGSAGPRTVTHFQLREPSRRSVEFLLGLEGPAAAARRAHLESSISSLRGDWSKALTSIRSFAGLAGARVVGLPDVPAGATARGRGDVVATNVESAAIEVLVGDEWIDDESALAALAEASRQHATAPRTVDSSERGALAVQLASAERALASRLTTVATVEQSLSLIEAQVDALDRRIRSLEEERSRYGDLKTLLRLGAEADSHSHAVSDDDCPTCHQSLGAVESEDLGPILDLDDSINLIRAELATAQQMRAEAARAQESARGTYSALAREVDAARLQVRTLREDLVSPADFPSTSAVASRLTAEIRFVELDRVVSTVRSQIGAMSLLALQVADERNELRMLPVDVPVADTTRIQELQASMNSQLEEFGFASYAAEKVVLSEETLRPVRPGFDLDADVSASDVVRIKVAYLNAIRETALNAGAPHPGLLILDEPRQHEMDEANFRSTLARLASAISGQVIVTSAARTEDLVELLGDTDCVFIDFDGKILSPQSESDDLDIE